MKCKVILLYVAVLATVSAFNIKLLGNYSKSCKEIKLVGSKISAKCEKKDKSWNDKATIDLNGCIASLGKESKQACSKCSLSGSSLKCSCSKGGKHEETAFNLDGKISNINGNLVCEQVSAKKAVKFLVETDSSVKGAYSRSCNSLSFDGKNLIGNCQRMNGSWQQTRLDLDSIVSNINGQLRHQKDGRFTQTCTGCTVNGGNLTCQCRTINGSVSGSTLNLDDVISNIDGNLRSDRDAPAGPAPVSNAPVPAPPVPAPPVPAPPVPAKPSTPATPPVPPTPAAPTGPATPVINSGGVTPAVPVNPSATAVTTTSINIRISIDNNPNEDCVGFFVLESLSSAAIPYSQCLMIKCQANPTGVFAKATVALPEGVCLPWRLATQWGHANPSRDKMMIYTTINFDNAAHDIKLRLDDCKNISEVSQYVEYFNKNTQIQRTLINKYKSQIVVLANAYQTNVKDEETITKGTQDIDNQIAAINVELAALLDKQGKTNTGIKEVSSNIGKQSTLITQTTATFNQSSSNFNVCSETKKSLTSVNVALQGQLAAKDKQVTDLTNSTNANKDVVAKTMDTIESINKLGFAIKAKGFCLDKKDMKNMKISLNNIFY